MPYRDPETGIVFDDMPWRPREEHTQFRVMLADYNLLCIPPNAVSIDPPGWPYPAIERLSVGRATGGAGTPGPPPVFVTVPWTRDGLALARDFWRRCLGWLGPTTLDSALAQLDLGERELDRREALDAVATDRALRGDADA